MKRLSILGSTGSIGTQTLDVVRQFPDRFQVTGLAAGKNIGVLVQQIREFRPRIVSVSDEKSAALLWQELQADKDLKEPAVEITVGSEGAESIARLPDTDFVVAAISGGAGLRSTAAAVRAGKPVGLANKESMVLAGEILMADAKRSGATLLPIDSEHSAIFQSLVGHNRDEVRRLILTASGGPLRKCSLEELEHILPSQALKHPNWQMGNKITIDSATLMNKGLEVIEARWLFDIEPQKIDILVHPESIIHSLVEYCDGSVIAQMGISDMRGPIAYTMNYPDRLPLKIPALDFVKCGKFTFEAPDPKRFPCYTLAYRALEMGGTAAAMLSGADEIAVEAFLAGRCRLNDIFLICENVLKKHSPERLQSIEQALAANEEGKRAARDYLLR